MLDIKQYESEDILSILENGWDPPKGWNANRDNSPPSERDHDHARQELKLVQRDHTADISCIPNSGSELRILVFNLWLTIFKPAVESGQSPSMEFSAFSHRSGGPNEIYTGGQIVVKIWTSAIPDWTSLKDPHIEDCENLNANINPKTDPTIEISSSNGSTAAGLAFAAAAAGGIAAAGIASSEYNKTWIHESCLWRKNFDRAVDDALNWAASAEKRLRSGSRIQHEYFRLIFLKEGKPGEVKYEEMVDRVDSEYVKARSSKSLINQF